MRPRREPVPLPVCVFEREGDDSRVGLRGCKKTLGNWFTNFKIENQFRLMVNEGFSDQWKMILV
jgi:hypothetical protein